MYTFEQIGERFPYIENIEFISKSNDDPSRITYLYKNIIIKSRKIKDDQTAHLRLNDLKAEYEILKYCKNVDGIPNPLYYFNNQVYELLFLNYLPGEQLYNLKVTLGKLFKLTLKLSIILIKLSAQGICHNDITPRNVLVQADTNVSLIDFDQAMKSKPLVAFARQLLGFNIGESKVNHSIFTIIKDYLRKKFPITVYRLKILLGKKYSDYEKLPELKNDSDPQMKKLLDAWKIAQKSNASSPGLPIAYYSLDVNESHFPGERPWTKRWDELKNITEYSGRTIIELGCNMGLLSTFLLKEAGATKCIGVDHDRQILKAAMIISEVYNVNPIFSQVNFDSNKGWEADLLSYNADTVFALNVLNWISDKERFLKFLSHFPEVIFEGHDTIEIERKRFEQIGFKIIEEIGYSERERVILRCRK